MGDRLFPAMEPSFHKIRWTIESSRGRHGTMRSTSLSRGGLCGGCGWWAKPALLACCLLPFAACEYVAGIGDRSAGLEGQGADGGTDARLDRDGGTGAEGGVTPDVAQGDDAPADVEVDAGGDGDAGDTTEAGIPLHCEFGLGTKAGSSTHGEVSSLVRIERSGAPAWAMLFATTSEIALSVVDDALQWAFAEDKVLVSVQGPDALGMGRLLWTGSRLFLVYSKYTGPNQGSTAVFVSEVDPVTGSTIGTVAASQPMTSWLPAFVGMPGVNAAQTRMLVPVVDQLAEMGDASAQFFSLAPDLVGAVPLAPSRGLAAAWEPDTAVFGVASVTVNGGQLVRFDSKGEWPTTYPFASAGVYPPWAHTNARPAILGALGRFYVAWISNDDVERAVIVNAYDTQTGQPLLTTPLTVASYGANEGLHPSTVRLVFDGQALIVAWNRVVDAQFAGDIHMKRYDPDLRQVGDELCNSCNAAVVSEGEFSISYSSAGRYAAAFYSHQDAQNTIVRLNCDDP
jgi:hypothetical protein